MYSYEIDISHARKFAIFYHPITITFGSYCGLLTFVNCSFVNYCRLLQDWWNCTNYHKYFRTWNVVVHDWLYTYIYKDMYEIVVPSNRTLSASTVFLVSSIFHEYIIAFAFGFFYPVMLVLFGGVGCTMFFVRKIITSNVFMWLTWSLGNGIMFSLYSMECYARHNCPPYSNYYLDLFLPRSWSCQGQFNM